MPASGLVSGESAGGEPTGAGVPDMVAAAEPDGGEARVGFRVDFRFYFAYQKSRAAARRGTFE